MRIEYEWGKAKRQNPGPEVYDPWGPDGHGYVEEHDRCPHTEVDARAGKTHEEDGKRTPVRRKSSARSDITSSAENQIACYSVRRDTGGKDLECRGKREDLFPQS